MKGGRETIWKDERTIFNRNSLASCLLDGEESRNMKGINSDPIPVDLTIELLTRLPAKSLVRFLCVSKLWSSIIRRRDFINWFLTRSSTRPRLLVTFPNYELTERFVFTLPNPKSPGVDSSSVAKHGMTIPGVEHCKASNSLRGLICCEIYDHVQICNPATRQMVTLPQTKSTADMSHVRVRYYLAYDPIDDQYKVLCSIAGNNCRKLSSEHQVFTLGAGNSWRSIGGIAPHCPETDGICINGVLYYGATTKTGWDEYLDSSTIVSFDVMSEKFNLMKFPVGASETAIIGHSTLTNYEGKLAVIGHSYLKSNGSIDLWVLEDAKKEEWLKMSCALPPPWRDFVGDIPLCLPGNVHTGEIILAPGILSNPFYVLYYDPKRNSFRKIEIEGTPDHAFLLGHALGNAFGNILTLSDHLESIMFLEDSS